MLLKGEEKKILKRLREVMLIFEKTQLPSLRKLNAKELKETVELVNSVICNVIINSITEMNNLLYTRVYAVSSWEDEKNKSNEKRKVLYWKRRPLANIGEWRKDVSRLN